MSDEIKHECGVAFIRLRKPFSFYQQQYGTVLYGLNKLYLLMEKQHNRGQDGAGIAAVKLNTEDSNAEGNLGGALAAAGKLAESKPHLERALKLDPNNSLARENLEQVNQALASPK